MKKTLKLLTLVLLVTISKAYAQSELYLNQISTSAVMNIAQAGNNNRIGSAGTPSAVTGDNVQMDIRQIGDGNTLDMQFNGNSNTMKLFNNGNNNAQALYVTGAHNAFDLEFVGGNNSMIFNNDGTSTSTVPANMSGGAYSFLVNGGQNTFQVGTGSGSNNIMNYNVQGNSNNVVATQDGLVSGQGHEQDVTIAGNSNNVVVNQAGSLRNVVKYNLTGSNTNTVITQGMAGAWPSSRGTPTGVQGNIVQGSFPFVPTGVVIGGSATGPAPANMIVNPNGTDASKGP